MRKVQTTRVDFVRRFLRSRPQASADEVLAAWKDAGHTGELTKQTVWATKCQMNRERSVHRLGSIERDMDGLLRQVMEADLPEVERLLREARRELILAAEANGE